MSEWWDKSNDTRRRAGTTGSASRAGRSFPTIRPIYWVLGILLVANGILQAVT